MTIGMNIPQKVVIDGTEERPVKSVAIDISTETDTTLIADGANANGLVVLGVFVSGAGTGSIDIKSGTTSKTGPLPLAAGSGIDFEAGGLQLFEIAAGEALVATTTGANQKAGFILYAER